MCKFATASTLHNLLLSEEGVASNVYTTVYCMRMSTLSYRLALSLASPFDASSSLDSDDDDVF